MQKYDYVIVGGGIIGLSVAYELTMRYPDVALAVIEKEEAIALHASGRNSGVLHAGFYYTKDSLKAKLTVEGNALMKNFCELHNIPVKATQKVVIAQDAQEVETLYELEERANVNGVSVKIIDEEALKEIDANVKTYQKALFSPNTASVNPKVVCAKLQQTLQQHGVDFYYNTPFEQLKDMDISYNYLINTAGLYADKIAQTYNIAKDYTILPFKGLYLKYMGEDTPVSINVYPVPHLKNPFLGVHFTITAQGDIKIGPTAIPAFWRENYKGIDRFNAKEMIEILSEESKLFFTNAFGFRTLAFEEMKNYYTPYLVGKAKKMLHHLDGNFKPLPAGIRAQLLDKKTKSLVQDFKIEHTKDSTHILNAVSPAFTCALSFAKQIVGEVEKNRA